jgi:hypothetical protein
MGYNKDNDWVIIRVIIQNLKKIVSTLKTWIDRVNKNREGKYSPFLIGICSALLSALLLTIMLFVPPYLGMADDGSFSSVANPLGIYHQEDLDENLYFNYYVKDYVSLASDETVNTNFSAQSILIRLAKLIDDFFTKDNIFDIRFLALIYGILFILSIAILIFHAAKRAKTFSQSVVIGLSGVLIFADVSYITFFSSFYSEPVMYICILLCVGAALGLKDKKHDIAYLIVFTLSGVLLTTSENQCAIIGVLLGILALRFLFINSNIFWRIGCISSVVILFISVMISVYYIPSNYTQTSKYHAMTRGVLFQASDPEKALEEFGIDASYAVLADTSSYDDYPLVNADSKALDKGFYDKYNSTKIAFYYFKHPKAMISMLDIAVKSSFNIRSGLGGNYEKSVGMPKMAKSLFWSFWSNFKANSAPKTLGFVVILFIAAIVLFRPRSLKLIKEYKERGSIPFDIILILFGIAISQALITIFNSGDTELSQHLFLQSAAIDLIIYFCFAEVLHRIKII